MTDDTIKFYGYAQDDRNTPEHRLWIAVLITFIDELISKTKDLASLQRKLKKQPNNNYLIKSLNLTENSIRDVIAIAKSQGTKNICEMIEIDHKWFVKNLNSIALSNLKSRPIRQMDYEVE